jgi:hypothetical protein
VPFLLDHATTMPDTIACTVFLQHGSLVTLYNRIKAQTSSTRFLAVAPNLRQIRGSDGKPLPIPSDVPTIENGFVADANSWDRESLDFATLTWI